MRGGRPVISQYETYGFRPIRCKGAPDSLSTAAHGKGPCGQEPRPNRYRRERKLGPVPNALVQMAALGSGRQLAYRDQWGPDDLSADLAGLSLLHPWGLGIVVIACIHIGEICVSEAFKR